MAKRPTDIGLRRVNGGRLRTRQVDELIGLARGVAADGVLNDRELDFLVNWLAINQDVTGDPIVEMLYQRVRTMLADGVFDEDERADLLATLLQFGSEPGEIGEVMKSTSIPFTDPAPSLEFIGWRYCFTGTFNHGVRADCEATVTARGAVAGPLTRETDVLVVGHYATESWLHSSYGTKIMKAVDLRKGGHAIAIVPEQHWAQYL